MELRKVLEIYNYKGDMWFIDPYISGGNIVRNTPYKVRENKHSKGWGRFTFYDYWGKGVYFTYDSSTIKVTENNEINTNVRVFTTRAEAKEALAEYERQNAYKISEAADQKIKELEMEKDLIERQIAKLKEAKKKAFKNLSNSFSKKS